MRFWSSFRLKSVYTDMIVALSFGVSLPIVGYTFLHDHHKKGIHEIQAQMSLELDKRFGELLQDHSLHLRSYLQNSAYFDVELERPEAMQAVWERILLGMDGVGYDAAILYDENLFPVFYNSRDEHLKKEELLKTILKGSLSLKNPVNASYFAPLSDGTLVEIFSAPLLGCAGPSCGELKLEQSYDALRGVYGYVVVANVWDSEYVKKLERLSGQRLTLFGADSSKDSYEIVHSLQDYFGNDVAFLGIKLDNRFIQMTDHMLSLQMLLVSIGGIAIVVVLISLIFVSILRPFGKLRELLRSGDRDLLKKLLLREDEFGDVAKVVQQSLRKDAMIEQIRAAIDRGFIVSRGDLKGNITYANDQFCEISGYSREELIGKNHNIVRHPDNTREFFSMLWKRITSGKIWAGVVKSRTKSGEDYYVRAVIAPILDEDGKIEEYLSIRTDITELYEQMQMIVSQTTDLLTGLPNKSRLAQDLEGGSNHARCLFFIDINQFRTVNDTFGEQAGDELLIEFVRRMEILIPPGSGLYRLGGDEFAILIDEAGESEGFALSLLENLEENPFHIANNDMIIRIRLSSACGVELLYQKCDMAMNYAKTNNLVFVDFDRNSQIRDELDKSREITRMIQEAIRSDFVQAYGQKIVSAKDPSQFKIETLMRIVDNKGKVTSPFIFLEQAKNTRLYSKLTRMMMGRVFEHFADKKVEFSINLTFEDLQDSETTGLVLETTKRLNLGQYVTIELVESEQIAFNDQIRGFIQEAKLLGCKISLDDFGSGYSNFDYILRVGADFIKIDGSLIRDINLDKNAYLTVKTIVSLAKELGILVVAEFIHSQEVMDTVVGLGVDYLQGFHLHEPEELGTLLASIQSAKEKEESTEQEDSHQ
ncbi:MAG: EAL domain-containing protein [Wolinella sp.]